MPWSVNNLPPSVEGMKLTEKEKKLFVNVANSVLKETGNEGRAIASGIAAVKRSRKDFEEIDEIKRRSEVQSVAFEKSKFNKTQAIAWLKENNMRHNTSRETENQIRFRQTDPNKYNEFRVRKVKEGISFILGIINKQKSDNNETKSIKVDFKFNEQEEGCFEGYASIFDNKDFDSDIVLKGAFIESLKKRKPKLLWQHDVKEPVGVYDEIKEDEKGLFVKGRLAIQTQEGKRAYELMKMGAIDGLSIGFKTVISEIDEENKARCIKQADLFEISIVTFPANPEATIIDVKNEKYIKDFENLKDIENFLKKPYALSNNEAKMFISKLTEFKLAHRDGEKEKEISAKNNERDVQGLKEALNECKKSLIKAEIYLSTN